MALVNTPNTRHRWHEQKFATQDGRAYLVLNMPENRPRRKSEREQGKLRKKTLCNMTHGMVENKLIQIFKNAHRYLSVPASEAGVESRAAVILRTRPP